MKSLRLGVSVALAVGLFGAIACSSELAAPSNGPGVQGDAQQNSPGGGAGGGAGSPGSPGSPGTTSGGGASASAGIDAGGVDSSPDAPVDVPLGPPVEVVLFDTADCSGAPAATLAVETDCAPLESRSPIQAVRIGGVCHNIGVTGAGVACRLYQHAASPEAVELRIFEFPEFFAFTSPTARCEYTGATSAFARYGASTYRAGGVTLSADDVPLVDACRLYAAAGARDAVTITNDAAGTTPIAYTSPRSVCNWSGLQSREVRFGQNDDTASAVVAGGSVRDMVDVPLHDACKFWRHARTRDAVAITSDDGGTLPVAFSAPTAQCDWADVSRGQSSSLLAAGLSFGGAGRDVRNHFMKDACKLWRGAAASDAVFLASDAAGNAPEAIISNAARCDWSDVDDVFFGHYTVTSIRTRGVTVGVQPVALGPACERFAPSGAAGGTLVFASNDCTTALAGIGPRSNCASLSSALITDVRSRLVPGAACVTSTPLPFAQTCRDISGH